MCFLLLLCVWKTAATFCDFRTLFERNYKRVQGLLLRNHSCSQNYVQFHVRLTSSNDNPAVFVNFPDFSFDRYEVEWPEDNTYGKELANGRWNGMVGMVVDQVIRPISYYRQ